MTVILMVMMVVVVMVIYYHHLRMRCIRCCERYCEAEGENGSTQKLFHATMMTHCVAIC
jgi:hypothetical protein